MLNGMDSMDVSSYLTVLAIMLALVELAIVVLIAILVYFGISERRHVKKNLLSILKNDPEMLKEVAQQLNEHAGKGDILEEDASQKRH